MRAYNMTVYDYNFATSCRKVSRYGKSASKNAFAIQRCLLPHKYLQEQIGRIRA